MGKWIKPINVRFHGNQQQAENMTGQVRKELGILENLMGFRGLAIGQRTRQFDDGSAIKVGIINGRAVADIVTPGMMPAPSVSRSGGGQEPAEKKTVRLRPDSGEGDQIYYGQREWILKKEEFGSVIIVISSKSTNEAFAWDIINREIVVGKASKEQVFLELSEMTPFKHVNPQQLLPSETATEETEISSWLGEGITTIPEKWNVPAFLWAWMSDSFYWDSSEAPYGVGCSPLGLPDLYGVEYGTPEEDALERCLKVARDYSIINDPDLVSGDYKGQYLIHLGCPIQDVGHYPGEGYDPGDRLYCSGGKIFYHRIFDNEHNTEWVKYWGVTYDEFFGACVNMVQQFAEKIQEENCYWDPVNAEKEDRKGQIEYEMGVASNDESSVCFENLVHRWDSEYTRDLRFFFRHKEPALSNQEQKALDLINFERAKLDLPECHWNHVLYRACLRHSQDMADNDFLGHQGTDGTQAAGRADQEGRNAHPHVGRITYWISAYELAFLTHVLAENAAIAHVGIASEYGFPVDNIYSVYYETITQPEYSALGFAENAVALWMASTKGHRELILNEIDGMEEDGIYQQLPDVAIACVVKNNKSYWTYLRNVSYNFWPGFCCVPTDNIMAYIDSNFSFNGDGDEMKMLDFFLMEAQKNDDS